VISLILRGRTKISSNTSPSTKKDYVLDKEKEEDSTPMRITSLPVKRLPPWEPKANEEET